LKNVFPLKWSDRAGVMSPAFVIVPSAKSTKCLPDRGGGRQPCA